MISLTEAVKNIEKAKADLDAHQKASAARTAEINAVIKANREVLSMSAAGIDREKVTLAESVVYVSGLYVDGGDERASVIADAVRQLATGRAKGPYCDLWRQHFGTKRYDRWYGQRSDHDYGYGPSHGSIIFEVGLKSEVRKREPRELTADEIEAAVYYLTNIERIQAARINAASGVAA